MLGPATAFLAAGAAAVFAPAWPVDALSAKIVAMSVLEARLGLLVERQWLWKENRAMATRLRYAQFKIAAHVGGLAAGYRQVFGAQVVYHTVHPAINPQVELHPLQPGGKKRNIF